MSDDVRFTQSWIRFELVGVFWALVMFGLSQVSHLVSDSRGGQLLFVLLGSALIVLSVWLVFRRRRRLGMALRLPWERG